MIDFPFHSCSRVARIVTALAIYGGSSAGQSPSSVESDSVGYAKARASHIFLLIASPGPTLDEAYGHTALRVVNSVTGEDVAWNWGLLDIRSQRFPIGIVFRDPSSRAIATRTQALLREYKIEGRGVQQEELLLTGSQRQVLLRELRGLQVSGTYAYQFASDNCTTRIRDLLDRVLGGSLRQQSIGLRTGRTWRSELLPPLADRALVRMFANLVLGSPADREMNAWEAMFLPSRLADVLRHVKNPADSMSILAGDPQGVLPPIRTNNERLIGRSIAHWFAWTSHIAIILAAVGVGALLLRHYHAIEIVLRVSAFAWYFLSGTAGLIVGLCWAVQHEPLFASNVGILFYSPVSLVVAAALTMRGSGSAKVVARVAALLCCVSGLIGFALLRMRLTTQSDEGFSIVLSGQVVFALALALAPRRVWKPSVRTLGRRPLSTFQQQL